MLLLWHILWFLSILEVRQKAKHDFQFFLFVVVLLWQVSIFLGQNSWLMKLCLYFWSALPVSAAAVITLSLSCQMWRYHFGLEIIFHLWCSIFSSSLCGEHLCSVCSLYWNWHQFCREERAKIPAFHPHHWANSNKYWKNAYKPVNLRKVGKKISK